MDRLTGLHVTHIGVDYIQVEWNDIKGVDGYSIQTILPQKYPKIKPQTTTETRFRVQNLIQGVNINIKVSGIKKNFYGRPASISSILPGSSLPEVTDFTVTDHNNVPELKWNLPSGTALKNITYGIYYGTKTDELYEEAKQTTQSMQVTLNDLMPCESYIISVGILGPIGPGPLVAPKIYETKYNETKPPRNVKASMNADEHQIELTWEHNCPLHGHIPSGYIVTLTDLSTNVSSSTELKRKGAKVLSHIIRDVHDGAVYNLSISTNARNAEKTTLTIRAPSLPPVRQLKVYPEKNGTYVVYWHEIEDNKGK